MLKFILFLVTVLFSQEFKLNAQIITIPLTELTYTDNISAGVRSFRDSQVLSPITDEYFDIGPSIFPVELPEYKYFSVYTSEGDGFIDVLVKPGINGDSLYIDFNNDNDLRNDGGPFFFPAEDYEFVYSLTFSGESERTSYRSLLRYPSYALTDSSIFNEFWEENFDSLGNLNQERTIYWQRHDPKFKGKKGSFYYLGRMNLKKGLLDTDSGKMLIGVQDLNLNGLFNDPDDRIHVDLDGDKALSYRNTSEFSSIADTILIYNRAFAVHSVDPIGSWIKLIEVEVPQLDRFVLYSLPKPIGSRRNIFWGKFNPDIWSESFETVDGQKFSFLYGKQTKLLINFWGEWCQPCYKEMPLLAQLNNEHASEISIVSFLLTGNLEKAKEVIEEQNMDWPHILVNDSITNWFNINGYPANFFISSLSDTVILTNGLDSNFIEKYILD